MNDYILKILPADLNFLVYTGLLILFAQIAGKISNHFRAPRLIGYLTIGIITGPYVLNIFSNKLINEQLSLIIKISLSIIAFSIGGALRNEKIKPLLKNIMTVTLSQAMAAFISVLIFSLLLLPEIWDYSFLKIILPCAMIFAAVSVPTDPATVMSIVHELKSRGPLTTILLGVVAIDDAIAIIIYGFVITFARSFAVAGQFSIGMAFFEPLIHCAGALVIGLAVAVLMIQIIKHMGSRDVLLGLMIGAIILTTGLAETFNVSPLLSSMLLSYIIINFTEHERANEIYEVIENIEEPIFGIFFLLAGAHLNIQLAFQSILVTFIILISRYGGKIAGSYAGMATADPEKKYIKKYLGLSLLPSAGVAIALIFDAAPVMSYADTDLPVIMISAVIGCTLINEIISPFLVRHSLLKSCEARIIRKASLKQPGKNMGRAGNIISHHIKEDMNNKND